MDKVEVAIRVGKKDAVNRLLENKDFIDIILVDYMKETIHELMYREGSSDGTIRGIDARKSLNDFIYGLIEEGKIASEGM